MKLTYENTILIEKWLDNNRVREEPSYQLAFRIYKEIQYNGEIVSSNSVSKRIYVAKKQIDFILKSMVNIIYKRNNNSAKGMKCGYVYAISNPAWDNYLKIGSAIDVYDRLNSYQTSSPLRDYSIVDYVFTDDRIRLEKEIHNRFDRDNEWVKADANIIKQIFRQSKVYPDDQIEEFCLLKSMEVASKSPRVISETSGKLKLKQVLLNHSSYLSKRYFMSDEDFIGLVKSSKAFGKNSKVPCIPSLGIYSEVLKDGSIALLL